MNKNDSKNEHRNVNATLKSSLISKHILSDINTATYSWTKLLIPLLKLLMHSSIFFTLIIISNQNKAGSE